MRNISMNDENWISFKLDENTTNELKNEIKTLNKNNEAEQAKFVLKLKK